MRALLPAPVAAAAVVGLAGCGQDGTPAGAKASEKPSTVSTGTSVTAPVPPLSTSVRPPPSPPLSPSAPRPREPKPSAGAPPTPPVTMGPNGPVVPPGVTQVPEAR